MADIAYPSRLPCRKPFPLRLATSSSDDKDATKAHPQSWGLEGSGLKLLAPIRISFRPARRHDAAKDVVKGLDHHTGVLTNRQMSWDVLAVKLADRPKLFDGLINAIGLTDIKKQFVDLLAAIDVASKATGVDKDEAITGIAKNP